MPTPRRTRFVFGLTAWLTLSIVVLTAFDSFSYELFFVCSFLGLVLVTRLTKPTVAAPQWRAPLPWLVRAGMLVFVYVAGRRTFELVQPVWV